MIEFQVNGAGKRLDVEADMPLLWVIREHLRLTGTKFGCGIGQCGACTVHLDGEPVRSCITPAAAAAGRSITTIEGLAKSGEARHPLQQAWIDEQVPQCGYCQSGQIMAAAALLAEHPGPGRRRHQRRHARQHLPLRHLRPHSAGDQEGRDRRGAERWRVSRAPPPAAGGRARGVIAAGVLTTGALVVGVAVRPRQSRPAAAAPGRAGRRGALERVGEDKPGQHGHGHRSARRDGPGRTLRPRANAGRRAGRRLAARACARSAGARGVCELRLGQRLPARRDEHSRGAGGHGGRRFPETHPSDGLAGHRRQLEPAGHRHARHARCRRRRSRDARASRRRRVGGAARRARIGRQPHLAPGQRARSGVCGFRRRGGHPAAARQAAVESAGRVQLDGQVHAPQRHS